LTPFSASQLKKMRAKDHRLYVKMLCFNNYLSSHRITIERAFGLFTAKWGILWRPLEHTIAVNALILKVCAKLHNKSIDNWKAKGVRADQIAERERVFDLHQHDSRIFQGQPFANPISLVDVDENPNPNTEKPDETPRCPSVATRKFAIVHDLHDKGIFYSTRSKNAVRLVGPQEASEMEEDDGEGEVEGDAQGEEGEESDREEE
jgi:hypothetical protein